MEKPLAGQWLENHSRVKPSVKSSLRKTLISHLPLEAGLLEVLAGLL